MPCTQHLGTLAGWRQGRGAQQAGCKAPLCGHICLPGEENLTASRRYWEQDGAWADEHQGYTMKKLAMLCVLLPAAAFAHAHLQKSSPAEGAALAVAPKSVQLQFSEAAQLTGLSVQRKGAALQALPHATVAAAKQVEAALPELVPGQYALAWRVLSADGHVMNGTLHFTVGTAH
jgi:methionine-rich copper-binding protein CopC